MYVGIILNFKSDNLPAQLYKCCDVAILETINCFMAVNLYFNLLLIITLLTIRFTLASVLHIKCVQYVYMYMHIII